MQAGNFVIDQTTADVTVAAADPAAARTYTFPMSEVTAPSPLTLTPWGNHRFVRRVRMRVLSLGREHRWRWRWSVS